MDRKIALFPKEMENLRDNYNLIISEASMYYSGQYKDHDYLGLDFSRYLRYSWEKNLGSHLGAYTSDDLLNIVIPRYSKEPIRINYEYWGGYLDYYDIRYYWVNPDEDIYDSLYNLYPKPVIYDYYIDALYNLLIYILNGNRSFKKSE